MYGVVIDKIDAYGTIVIHRHIQPDLDALGSQLGLRNIIKKNFKNKKVYVVGEGGDYDMFGPMDRPEDHVFEQALAIVLDVAGKDRVSDQRFLDAKETIVIDHHRNPTDFADIFISDPEQVATCQMLVQMCKDEKLKIDADAATYLFAGLTTDSGRFLYPATDATTFDSALYLVERGARIQEVYNLVYEEDLNKRKLRGYFINHFKWTKNNVAYMKNPKTLKNEYNVSTFTISRGMVNQMAGIKEIPIWANFTETDSEDILCELRSKEVPIVDIAKKFGGGGHDLACGCTVASWDETDRILEELDKIAERIET